MFCTESLFVPDGTGPSDDIILNIERGYEDAVRTMVHWMETGVLCKLRNPSMNASSPQDGPDLDLGITKDSWRLLVRVCILAEVYSISVLYNEATDRLIQFFGLDPCLDFALDRTMASEVYRQTCLDAPLRRLFVCLTSFQCVVEDIRGKRNDLHPEFCKDLLEECWRNKDEPAVNFHAVLQNPRQDFCERFHRHEAGDEICKALKGSPSGHVLPAPTFEDEGSMIQIPGAVFSPF